MNVRTVTGAATLTDTDDLLLCEAVSNGFNVTLPPAAGRTGKAFTVRRIDTLTNTNYAISVRGPIDGYPDRHLWTRSSYVTVVSDGTAWRVISESGAVRLGEFYVSSIRGHDANHGRDEAYPLKTIMAAVVAAGSHANIHVDSGLYNERVDLSGHFRIHLWGVPGSLGNGTRIKALADQDALVISGPNAAGCGAHNLIVMGAGGTWNQRAVVVDGAPGAVVENIACLNADGTIPSPAGPDPGYGGTAFYIANTEHCVFTNLTAQEFRRGWHSTGNVTNAQQTVRKLIVSRCWQDMLCDGPVVGNMVFESVKFVNPLGRDPDVWSVDVRANGCTFINWDFSEGGPTRKARFTGDNNTFIECVNAVNTTVYFEGNGNTLLNWLNQKKVVVNGRWNRIDRMHGRGANQIQLEINGNDNIVDRSLKDTNSVITGTGLRTKIDGVTA